MKRFVSLLLLLLCLTACGTPAEPAEPVTPPQVEKIRSICELATLECRYNNVARSVKKAPPGFTHIGEKDRIFWVEYTGIARIGIDLSAVSIELDGDTVTVTLPAARTLSISVDESTLDQSAFYLSEDGINPNPITAEDQITAIRAAQEDMTARVAENTALMVQARDRAQKLIENYIRKVGDAAGVTYELRWRER